MESTKYSSLTLWKPLTWCFLSHLAPLLFCDISSLDVYRKLQGLTIQIPQNTWSSWSITDTVLEQAEAPFHVGLKVRDISHSSLKIPNSFSWLFWWSVCLYHGSPAKVTVMSASTVPAFKSYYDMDQFLFAARVGSGLLKFRSVSRLRWIPSSQDWHCPFDSIGQRPLLS